MAEIVLVEANDAFTHVALRGKLDTSGVADVELELKRQLLDPRKPAIVDISAVDVLASIGVGLLVRNARLMHSYGLIFGVVATGLGKEILERLKVDTIFPVVATREEALRTLMLD